MLDVLFLVKKNINSYGISIGLNNSAQFVVNYLNSVNLSSKLEYAIDGNCIDRIVTETNPKIVIVEALWVTPEKIEELITMKSHKGRLWIIRTHSKIPFLSEEGNAYEWLYKYSLLTKKYGNLIHSPNSEEISNDMDKLFKVRNVFLPNVYMPFVCENEVEKLSNQDGRFHVGCFGAIRPLKNQLIQAQAAVDYAIDNDLDLAFHINAGRVEQKGGNALKNIKSLFEATDYKLVEHHWLNHQNFSKLCKSMDMGLQVSFTESFNIVAADFVWNHVPIVVSPEIDWINNFCQASPNSTKSIQSVIGRIKVTQSLGLEKIITNFNVWNLDTYNKDSKKKWFHFISKNV